MTIDRLTVAIPQTDPRAGYLAQRTRHRRRDRPRSRRRRAIFCGREVEAFEAAFADFVGVAHAIGVGSGTDAIELALRACGIGAGDLVFTVSHTAVATVAAIERAGATPVLVDVEPGTFTMAPRELARACRRRRPAGRRRCCRCTSMASRPIVGPRRDRPDAWFAADRGLRAKPWRALSRQSRPDRSAISPASAFIRQKISARSAMAAWSSPTIRRSAAALREIREYGWRERYVSARAGINSRLDPIQAAILGVKLSVLDGRQCAPPGHRGPL